MVKTVQPVGTAELVGTVPLVGMVEMVGKVLLVGTVEMVENISNARECWVNNLSLNTTITMENNKFAIKTQTYWQYIRNQFIFNSLISCNSEALPKI